MQRMEQRPTGQPDNDPKPIDRQLIDDIDAYCDEAPRAAADAHMVGPFTVFVRRTPGWPYYARPTIGEQEFTADDVTRVMDWQADKGLEASIEWIEEATPGLAEAARAAGAIVRRHPLMELRAPEPAGVGMDRLAIREVSLPAELEAVSVVGDLSFGHEGTATGPQGLDDVTAALSEPGGPDEEAAARAQADAIAAGHLIQLAAFDGALPVAVGGLVPRGEWAEVVGVGTLPAYRRRGIGLALTSELVARGSVAGATRFFLSAADGDVARMYERAGFERIGHAGVAQPPRGA